MQIFSMVFVLLCSFQELLCTIMQLISVCSVSVMQLTYDIKCSQADNQLNFLHAINKCAVRYVLCYLLSHKYNYKLTTCTVVPAKSDSDVYIVYNC